MFATTKISVTKESWTQVSTSDGSVTIQVRSGSVEVFVGTETPSSNDAGLIISSFQGEGALFLTLDAENVYVRAMDNPTTVVVLAG